MGAARRSHLQGWTNLKSIVNLSRNRVRTAQGARNIRTSLGSRPRPNTTGPSKDPHHGRPPSNPIATLQTDRATPPGDRAPSGREISRTELHDPRTFRLSGKVIPEEDLAEVDRRAAAYIRDLGVRTDLGRDLARQLAVTAVRMDRCSNHEAVAIAHARRHAVDRHDDAREDEANRLFMALGEDPRINLRRLKRMPEGIPLLIEAWVGLRADLTRKPRPRWTPWHRERAENLTGNRSDHNPYTGHRRPLRGDLGSALRRARGGQSAKRRRRRRRVAPG